MNDSYPGILISDAVRKRAGLLWLFVGAFMGVGAVFLIAHGVVLVAQGDTTSTTRVRGFDVPTWSLGFLGLAVVPLAWWQWKREAGATSKREGVVNIHPMQGGLYLVGNYRSAMGVSLPVADNSPLRIALQKTGSASYGLIKLYGLRMTSAHGDVLMDLRLMPKALDLSPLLAELRRRRIAVDLDPALDAQHDHGASPHFAPPSGPVAQSYQSGPPQPSQRPTYQPPTSNSKWDPR